jgi:predicted aspartyl protease
MRTKSANGTVLGLCFVASRKLPARAATELSSSMARWVLIFVLFSMPISAPSVSAQTTSVLFTRTGSSIVVDVTVGGKARHFLLDTGAGLTVLSPVAAGWSPVDLKKLSSNRSVVGLDGVTHSMGSTTATLELGQTMIVTPAAVADLQPLSKALNAKLDGILGQDVLSQFSRVTIHYKNKQLILEK